MRKKNASAEPATETIAASPTSPASSPAVPLPTDQIVIGECIATMATWPAASIDLIFSDPPYNIGYAYDQYDDSREYEDYVKWTNDWIDQCVRLLKPTGSFYILIGDEFAAETRMHLRTHERKGNLAFRNWVIWHYTFGQNCRGKFNRSHVHLFYCTGSASAKGKISVDNPPFAFNRADVAIPSARQMVYGDLRANPTGKLPDDVWLLRPREINGSFYGPDEDTWFLSRLCGTFGERVAWHPCQLPEALLERVILVSSNKGDVVFDPFTGSGTTAAVAARLGRRFLGTELSPEYAAKARERIEHARTTGTAVRSTQAEKGMTEATRKKKPEPKRSGRDQVQRSASAAAPLFDETADENANKGEDTRKES